MHRTSRLSHFSGLVFALLLAGCATQDTTSTSTASSASQGSAAAATAGAKAPAPPYYSVQLATVATEQEARASFALAGNADFIRAEQRNGQYALRAGAWQNEADAMQAMERYKAQGIKDAYVIHCHTQPAFIQP